MFPQKQIVGSVGPGRATGRARAIVVAAAVLVCAAAAAGTAWAQAAPAISSVGPGSGPKEGGSTVFISGSGFTAGAAVAFGGAAAPSVTVQSATTVIAVTPPSPIGAGAATVRVTNTDGQFAERVNGFTYLTLIPAISAVVPYYAPTAGGATVTINGLNLNLDPGVRFTFGGLDATIQSVSARSATVVVPAHPPGVVDVSVSFTDGRSSTFAQQFLYGEPPPIGHRGAVERVSIGTDGNQATVFSGYNIGSRAGVLTPDGRTVAFLSDAADLIVPDPGMPPRGTVSTIYIRDRQSGQTSLVAAQGPENFPEALSADGRFVALKIDGPGPDHVYRYDRLTGTPTLANPTLAGALPLGTSYAPAMSRDGRYVAFASAASDLVPGDTNGRTDVFLRDLDLATTTGLTLGGDGNAGSRVAIGADGRYVFFTSQATNLVPGDTNGKADLFVYDTATTSIERLGLGPGGVEPNGDASQPFVTPDGRFVAFASAASNLVAGDTNNISDVFLLDRATATVTRVSVASDGGATNTPASPRGISADGRRVSFTAGSFTTLVPNVVTGDINGASDLFVRDMRSGETILVGVGADGILLPRGSSGGALSDDGSLVLIDAVDPLVAGDTNGRHDVYIKHIGNTPAGADVMVAPVDPSTGGQPVTITFSEVTSPGETTVVSSTTGPAAPAGFALIGTYYDITTSAGFTPPATVCVVYPVPMPEGVVETDLALYHDEGSAWVALPTVSQDTDAHVICASTTSFSPFAVFGRPEAAADLTGRMVGGGTVGHGRSRAVFELHVRESGRGERGRVSVVAAPRGGRFVSTGVDAVAFDDDPAFQPGRRPTPAVDSVVFSGTGRWNGRRGYTFEAAATDRGEPGRGRDTFTITIGDASGNVVMSAAGTLEAGNIQSMRVRR